jgi:hypothetical protein
MKKFAFASAALVVFGLFIFSLIGNVYAQSNTDIKKSNDAEHTQLPPAEKHEAASKSETKDISSSSRKALSPLPLKKTMDSPSKESSARPGRDSASGASGDSLKPVDCCEAHICCN